MTQYQFNDINPDVETGTTLASDLNSWKAAVESGHSGSSRPVYIRAGMSWVNISSNPWKCYLFDGTDDVLVGLLDYSANKFYSDTSPVSVSSVASLRGVKKEFTSKVFVEGYYATGDGGGGYYYYDSSDTSSSDNGGSIIVATDGARWKLILHNTINIKSFGAKGDGTTDDSASFSSAIGVAQGRSIEFPKGIYNLSSMTPASGLCRLVSNGEAEIIGFSYIDLTAPVYNSGSTNSPSDAHFEAKGITFTGTGTTPALFIKNQSQSSIIRSADITNCVFRGQIGLVLENAQGCKITGCDFIKNQYGLKTLSATNNSVVCCNFYSPIVGVLIDTSSSDTVGRKGGENLKFVNCMWIDGVTAIKCLRHNYLWLTSCLIDYFNSGIYMVGSRFARVETTYIGCVDSSKSSMPNYIAPTQLGCVYATADAAITQSSGIECINSEFMAYGLSSKPCMQLVGNGFSFGGIEEVDIVACRFGSISTSNTMSNLLSINTANDLYMTGNKFFSPSNNNITAPWVLSNLSGGRFVLRDNDFANVFNNSGVNIPPSTGDIGNEVYETAQISLPTNGTVSTNTVSYTYKQKYKSTPRVVAMVKAAPVAVELLNVSNAAQDTSLVYLCAARIDGTTMAAGSNVIVDLIIMGA